MITKKQRRNAERIAALSDAFGHVKYNGRQTVDEVLNLSIPMARLVIAGVATGVADTNDGINDNAVAEVEELCRLAFVRMQDAYGSGWWTDRANELGLIAEAVA